MFAQSIFLGSVATLSIVAALDNIGYETLTDIITDLALAGLLLVMLVFVVSSVKKMLRQRRPPDI
jgi:uncharacterized membrane protein